MNHRTPNSESGGEGAVEQRLKEVLRLPQRLPLHRPQTLVTRHQRRELLLLREWRDGNWDFTELL